MKKKILSIALTFMMIVGLATGFNNSIHAEGEVTLIVNGSTADDTAERANNATYKTIAGALAKANNGDTIQLGSDITENITIAQGKEVVLDLNGYVLSAGGSGRVIDNSGTLTIIDSNNANAEDHYFKVLSTGLWQLQSDFTGDGNYEFNAANGLAMDPDTPDVPGTDSIIAVSGGVITGGYLTETYTGAGIENHGGTITMNGGNIIGNHSGGDGGGICNKKTSSDVTASFTMTGGSIVGNVAGSSIGNGAGGGVANIASDFTMTGGRISYNSAGTSHGGGAENNGSMTVGGTAVIKDNFGYDNSQKISDNLFLDTDTLLSVSSSTPFKVGAEIGITLESATGAVTEASKNDNKNYFFSDNTDYVVFANFSKLKWQVYIGKLAAKIVETGIQYNTVQEAVNATNGMSKATVQILKDANLSDTLENGSTNCPDITLDLNGYVLALSADSNVIQIYDNNSVNVVFTVKDSEPTREHDSGSLPNGGVITGGTCGIRISAGTVTMTGGTITGNTNCGVSNASGFVMTGGTITGNTGDAFVGGVVNEADSYSGTAATMAIGGTAVINDNKLTDGTERNICMVSGAKITIGNGEKTSDEDTEHNGIAAPASGMSAGVTVFDEQIFWNSNYVSITGIFTSNGSEADKQYFTSDNTAYVVKYNSNNYLELVEKTVCRIGTTEYKTIALALAAGHGDESTNPTVITMIEDREENVTINSDRNIILNLNSKTITGKITDYGKLTVVDGSENVTGKIYNKGDNWPEAIALAGTEASFTLESGTLETCIEATNGTAVTILNSATKGTINIKSGNVISTAENGARAYAVYDLCAKDGKTYTTAVNVTGGSFTGGLLLQNSDEGDLFNYIGHDETLINTMLDANGKIKITLDGDVKLTTNDLTVASGKNVILDLNGYVVKGTGNGAVITNEGKLTIQDTENWNSLVHYFKVADSGLWEMMSSAPNHPEDSVYDFSDGILTRMAEVTACDDIPAAGDIIDVSDGCITGGGEGGIKVAYSGELIMKGGNIIGNSNTNNGGGIYIEAEGGGAGSVSATNGSIVGNIAGSGYNGGGLYVDSYYDEGFSIANPGKAELSGMTIAYNKANKGGGIYLYGSELIVDDSFIKGNTAIEYGGGICEDEADKKIKIGLFDTEISNNTAGTNGGGVYFVFDDKYCLAAGTMITMSDGSTKAIENIVEGDLVKTFDHESGTVSSAKVYLAYKGDSKEVPFTLTFDNDTSLLIAGSHGLLEQSSRKYVNISETNANDYIGKYFYGQDGNWHKLLTVTKETESVDYYTICTSKHQNCFANEMLTNSHDTDYLLNIYELDENLKADEIQLQADITSYGLMTYEYASENYGIDEQWYEDAGVKYLNIAIGKGLTTLEYLENLYEETNNYVNGNNSPVPMLMGISPLLGIQNTAPTLDDISVGALTIGSGTTIKNNIAASKTENVYLEDYETNKTLIQVYGDNPTNIEVGVTLKNGIGSVTTATNKADYHSYFVSDNSDYIVVNDKSAGADFQCVKLVHNPSLIHNDFNDVNVNSDSGNGYKEFVVGNASNSVIHINKITLSDVYKDSVTDKYTGILVKNGDETLIEETDYTVSEGSVKVELTKEYLNKLAVGNYTVKVYLNMDGAATTDSNYYEGTINVKVKPAESGNTDSGSTYTVVNTSVTGTENNAVSKALGLIAMVTVAGTIALKKKEN